ncbi:hypothetical protein SPI_08891 [Niveomyces insectorum RCEF 264]|uniref:Methyltransferase domain-containing protein n=1 Tax=Niveomyces insectorum RCEF 264 TaxID=1081102 RepID=A0A167MF18_9HYPO|nr:hypothetical protein SPI_08891 [Niveomyces insectorum RCEF 264]
MQPKNPLPYADDEFASADDYLDQLLHYVSTTPVFQVLCGGVHIMDFYTTDPGLFYQVVPADWQAFLLDRTPMELLDFLLRADNLDAVVAPEESDAGRVPPPASLVQYVRDVRRFSLRRERCGTRSSSSKPPPLARHLTLGMSRKKVHEVTHFAAYVDRLATAVSSLSSSPSPASVPPTPSPPSIVTHLVDVGSGQNYLGRALASPPYGRRVVAVESKAHNIAGAQGLDVMTGVVVPSARPRRNKKLYQQLRLPPEKQTEKMRNRLARENAGAGTTAAAAADLRSRSEIAAEAYAQRMATTTTTTTTTTTATTTTTNTTTSDSTASDRIQYVEGRLANGDLSHVLAQVPPLRDDSGLGAPGAAAQPGFLTMSIHSCGNLSHHGLRALVLNPAVRAVAIVGCCYNLLTERLGPPTYKVPGLAAAGAAAAAPPPPPPRPTLQPVNGRVVREAERRDPEGFPMSARLCNYVPPGGRRGRTEDDGLSTSGSLAGIRCNITARMMACQAPGNWTEADSKRFFTRHCYRAILQRIFLDRGVIRRVRWGPGGDEGEDAGDLSADADVDAGAGTGTDGLALSTAVSPIIVGTLRKACYASLPAYVRGAVAKIVAQVAGSAEADNDNDGDPEADAECEDKANLAPAASVAESVAAKMVGLTDADLEAYAERYGGLRQRELSAVWSLMAFSAGVVEALIVADRWQYLREQPGVTACWAECVFDYALSPRNVVVVGIKG